MKIIKYGTTFMANFCKDFLDYFECNFKTSIEYNNNSIADWILSNCGFQKASLHCCVSNYNIQALIYFINHEILFYTKNSSNYVLFHSIYDLNLIKFFVGKGCNLFKVDDDQENVLFYALRNEYSLEIIQYLVTSGVNINTTNKHEVSPLALSLKYTNISTVSFLISKSSNLNIVDNNGDTLFHYIYEPNSLQKAQLLFERGLNIHSENNKGETPIDKAYSIGNFDVVNFLISKGAKPEYSNNNMKNPLIEAVDHCLFNIVQMFVEQQIYDINSFDDDWNTPLLYSLTNNHEQIFKYLIDHNASISIKDSHNNNALHIAIKNNCSHYIIDYLINSNSIDINGINDECQTPLHIACSEGYLYAAEKLIEKGADINAFDNEVKTPIFHACYSNHPEIVKFLLSKGAKTQIFPQNNETIIHAACYNKNALPILELLSNLDIDFNSYDSDGNIPLHIASKNGDVLMIDFLLKHGCEIDADTINEETPFYVACYSGNFLNAQYLFKHGSNLKYTNKCGETPLIAACTNSDAHSLVSFLISNGLNVNEKDNACQSPLYIASQSGSLYVVKKLVEKKADIESCSTQSETQ